jgi:2-polyprenyl-3-methyl-5-hydroxy-6-metoxy-1,4-benzoquinol methylase
MSIDYYNKNAIEFFEGTVNADMSATYDEFLKQVKPAGKILDAGCGSGRDTKYFLNKGYTVTAFDASNEMVRLSTELTGQKTLKMTFQEINSKEEFDGIWACASLLHISKAEIDDVLNKLIESLKPKGILFASFKYGPIETMKDDRLFNSYTEETLKAQFEKHKELTTIKIWKTQDVRPDRTDEYWVSVICRKVG